MSQTRRQQVAAAVKAIRAFHEFGRSLPAKASHKDGYGQGTVAVEAERHRLNPDTVRKARQFADPVNGYSAAEVNVLCRSIREVQEEQEGAVFGRTAGPDAGGVVGHDGLKTRRGRRKSLWD